MADQEMESVEAFAARARTWLAENLTRRDPSQRAHGFGSDEAELAAVEETRRCSASSTTAASPGSASRRSTAAKA